jgi:hypothetical protein
MLTFTSLIGLNFTLAIVIGAIEIALYLKNENAWIGIVILAGAGAIFGGALPAQFGMLGILFIILALVGSIMKVFYRS